MPSPRKPPQARDRCWVGYARKSTDTEDKQVHSLADQARMIHEYYDRLPPADRGGRPLRLVEEARSAYRPGRPVFDEILRMADRGQVHGLIVVHPNRVSRNHADSGAFVQRLVDGRIASLDTAGGKRYTGRDSNDIFMLTLEGAMSWKDSRDKGDRVRQAMRLRAAEGKHMGPARLGYRAAYRADGAKVLEVVPEAGAAVRRLFELAATGTYSVKQLADIGWELGLRGRGGKKVGKSALHGVLRHPIYYGAIRFTDILADGRHEPLVSRAVWDRVQRVLAGRQTGTARAKDVSLRDLFVFGSRLQCPKCTRALCPYRAKGRYVYYECKNPETRCRVCVGQTTLVEQLRDVLARLHLPPADVARVRDGLRAHHETAVAEGPAARQAVTAELDRVLKEIGDVFARRPEAEAMGIGDAVDLRLAALKRRRQELEIRLDAMNQNGTGWVDRTVNAFELVPLLQEAILYGSSQTRDASLGAIASNYSLDGKKLILKLRSPFREVSPDGGRPVWCPALNDARTEIEETVFRLEQVSLAFQAEQEFAQLDRSGGHTKTGSRLPPVSRRRKPRRKRKAAREHSPHALP